MEISQEQPVEQQPAEETVGLPLAPERRLKPLHIIGIVFLLVLVGLSIWYLLRHNQSHTKSPSNSLNQSFTYNDPHGVYTLKVPSSWQVQSDIAAPADLSGYTALAPAAVIKNYKQIHKNDYVNIVSIETLASTAKAKDWFNTLKLTNNVAEAKDLTINTYNVYGAKVITASGMDDHYVFSRNGTILHLIFHQRVVSSPKDSTDYSQYLSDYDRLATSVHFK